MQFCKVADIADWQTPEFQAAQSVLQLNGKHRKAWEFIQVYAGLQELGYLNGESRTLGLGVGHECLIYAFTEVCKEVIATDLYDSQTWATASMKPSEVYERSRFPYQRDRLTVHSMDMTNITYPDNSFDVIWSCCSIEHVNNFKELHRVFSEIHRVLKPGGIAALTTEHNKTDTHLYEPNLLYTDQLWLEKWLTGEDPLIQGFELIDQPNLYLSPLPENEPIPRRQAGNIIQVYTKDIINSSISFFLRKTGEFSRAYDDNWMPDFWRIYLSGCDNFRAGKMKEAEAQFRPLFEDESLEPRLRVRAARRLVTLLLVRLRLKEAAEVCKRVVPLCDLAEDEDQLLPLANYFKRLGLAEESLAVYKKVEQVRGANINQVLKSLIAQAEYLEHQENYSQALEIIKKAIALSKTKKVDQEVKRSIYYHQGCCYEQLDKIKLAVQSYESALKLAKKGSPFYATCYLKLRQCQTPKFLQPQRLWMKIRRLVKSSS
jgi:tetratricopeptide (TPR) repeat protein